MGKYWQPIRTFGLIYRKHNLNDTFYYSSFTTLIHEMTECSLQLYRPTPTCCVWNTVMGEYWQPIRTFGLIYRKHNPNNTFYYSSFTALIPENDGM